MRQGSNVCKRPTYMFCSSMSVYSCSYFRPELTDDALLHLSLLCFQEAVGDCHV